MGDDRYVAGVMCVRDRSYRLNLYLREGRITPVAEPIGVAQTRAHNWALSQVTDYEPFVVHVTDAERLK